MTSDRFITVTELARRMGCHRATVYRMIHAGRLPRPMVRRNRLVWLRAGVREYLK